MGLFQMLGTWFDRTVMGKPSVYTSDDRWVSVDKTESSKRLKLISQDVCPNCKHDTKFYMGPEGGASVNIQCVTCGWWFNASPFGAENIGLVNDTKKLPPWRPELPV